MRLTIERSGGVAGIMRRAVVDDQQLPPAAAAEFRALVAAVDFVRLSRLAPGKGQPDRFVYAITAELDDKTYALSIGESAMPDSLAACVAFAFDRTDR